MIHTVGAATWSKLTPEQRRTFREESAAAGDLMRKLMAEQETDQIKKLEAAGMQITRPDLAPFRARMVPAYQRIAAYAGEDNVKKFRDMGGGFAEIGFALFSSVGRVGRSPMTA